MIHPLFSKPRSVYVADDNLDPLGGSAKTAHRLWTGAFGGIVADRTRRFTPGAVWFGQSRFVLKPIYFRKLPDW